MNGTHGRVGGNIFVLAYVLAMVPPFLELLRARAPGVSWAAALLIVVTAAVTAAAIRSRGGGGAGEALGCLGGILAWAGWLAAPLLSLQLVPGASEARILGGSLPPLLMTIALVIGRRHVAAVSRAVDPVAPPISKGPPPAGADGAEAVAAHARAFVERFLPAIAPGTPTRPLRWTHGAPPTQEAVDDCLRQYARLLSAAHAEGPSQLLQFDVMVAGEVAIAHASAGSRNGRSLAPHADLAAFIRRCEPDVRAGVQYARGGGHDALARLITIAETVEAATRR